LSDIQGAPYKAIKMHGKNDFAEENFAGYRSGNNFIGTLKLITNNEFPTAI